MKEHPRLNSQPFMGGYYIDEGICDDLVSVYEDSSQKQRGVVIGSSGVATAEQIKTSTDLSFWPNDPDKRCRRYVAALLEVIARYKQRYTVLDANFSEWGIVERINIQNYDPHEGFIAWHNERSTRNVCDRLLVFMTYLNDVTDRGQTEWQYQDLLVAPEKGLTVIWPADWMFTHRGITSPTQRKIIVTGWLGFI